MTTATLQITDVIHLHAAPQDAMPPKLRSIRQFAAEEIELADGEREGQRFNPDFQRWPGLVLDLLNAANFREYWLTGPRQTGKTLILVIAMIYHLFERRENVIGLAPTDDLAYGWFKDKVLPIIERSRYAHFLPKVGAGSRGGKVKAIKFRNNVTLRFFGAGKHSASTFTARVIFVTEASKMEMAGAVDGEADPISAVRECASSFTNPVIYSDCITTSEAGIVHDMVNVRGTASKVMLPCVHCGCWQYPERERFKGWQDAPDKMTAGELARYYCIGCGAEWSENDRHKSLERSEIVHKGQVLEPDGAISGDHKRTDIMGLQWNALCSALRKQEDLGKQEWDAKDSGSPKAEQALCQYVWALPYVPDVTDLTEIDAETIAGKLIALGKGVIPHLAETVILSIDLGGHIKGCNWALGAFYGRRIGHICDYGVFHPAANSEDALEAALLDFWMTTASQGWAWQDSTRKPDLILIDSGWKPQAVYSACNIIGSAIAKPTKGYSLYSDTGRTRYKHKERGRTVPKSGDQWHESRMKNGQRLIHIDGDYYKRRAQESFTIATGQPGSMTLYHVPSAMHMRGIDGKGMGYARHMVAEREIVSNIPGQGEVRKWEQIHKANDWLDCTGNMLAGADYQGIRLAAGEVKPKGKRRSLAERRKDQRQRGRR